MNKIEKKVFIDFIKKFYFVIVFYLISTLFRELVNIFIVNLVGNTTDLIMTGNISFIKDNVVKFLMAFAVVIIIVPVIKFVYGKIYVEVGVKFDSLVYNNFLKKKIAFLKKYDKGELIYRVEADPVDYRGKLLTIIGDGLSFIIILVISFIFMSFINVKFALITIVLTIFPMIFTIFLKDRVKHLYEENKFSEADIFDLEKNIVNNFAFIKVHRLKDEIIENVNKVYSRYLKVIYKKLRTEYFLININILSDLGFEFLLYIIGSIFIAEKYITIGQGVTFFGIAAVLRANSDRLKISSKAILEFNVASKRIAEFMSDLESDNNDNNNKLKSIDSIEFKNVSFAYDDENVIKNLSFKITKGDKVIIKGSNGSGKSTLIKLLIGLYDNYEGSILINDTELSNLNKMNLRNLISVAPQFPFIFNGSIYDNITCWRKEININRLDAIMKKLSLFDVKHKDAGEEGKQLSGGQKQKISLARTMLENTSLLIVDEPETTLDIESKNLVNNFIINNNNTVIIISHNNTWSEYENIKCINL